MLDAMKALKDGLPISIATRVHGVPKTSLCNRIKGKVFHGIKSGPKQYLSAEEETELAEFAASILSSPESAQISSTWVCDPIHIHVAMYNCSFNLLLSKV